MAIWLNRERVSGSRLMPGSFFVQPDNIELMPLTTRVLTILADGDFHSGTAIGHALEVSRAAVCKAVKILTESGLHIARHAGRGYRLDSRFIPLNKDIIINQIGSAEAAAQLGEILLLDRVDSTNRYLLDIARDVALPCVCLAETQQAGRGRLGRHWVTTGYSNILLSLSWYFPGGINAIAGLSLAAGVGVIRALREYGIPDVGLKWPNDILWQGRKLAGLLVDIRAEAQAPALAVVGLGLNMFVAPQDAVQIDQPWVDICTILAAPGERNRMSGLLIRHLLRVMSEFERGGFETVKPEWEQYDVFYHKPVRLVRAHEQWLGVAQGVDIQGALVIEDQQGQLRRFYSGEISMRLAS